MRDYRFGNIQAYVEWKENRLNDWFFGVVIVLVLATGIGGTIHDHYKYKEQTPPPLVFTPPSLFPTWTSTLYVSGQPIQDGKGTGVSTTTANRALDEAIAAWRIALNDPALKRPALKPGFCSDQNAVACAPAHGNEIYFTGNISLPHGSTVDLKTIFMHEIGHILGVSHSEGLKILVAGHAERLNARGAGVSLPQVEAVGVEA